MCFSATASFASAVLTATAGAYTLSRVTDRREWPLASMPVFFALQQAIEGGLWLTLQNGPSGASLWLSHSFLVLALVYWPVFAPLAALALEVDVNRKRVIGVCGAMGAMVAAYFVWMMLTQAHQVSIVGGHIRYEIGDTPVSVGGAYIVATTIGLLVSSNRAVALLGLIVLAGSIVSYAFYVDAFVSVWCFFAAATSVVVAAHFSQAPAKRRI